MIIAWHRKKENISVWWAVLQQTTTAEYIPNNMQVFGKKTQSNLNLITCWKSSMQRKGIRNKSVTGEKETANERKMFMSQNAVSQIRKLICLLLSNFLQNVKHSFEKIVINADWCALNELSVTVKTSLIMIQPVLLQGKH